MSVWANGHLIYGFVHTEETAPLFDAITDAFEPEDDESYSFEEMHSDLQEKHGISMSSVGYANVDILCTYEACSSGKGFDITEIDDEAIAKTEEYKQKIRAFLLDLHIDPNLWKPKWQVLSYMS